jgi:hypothetical protein
MSRTGRVPPSWPYRLKADWAAAYCDTSASKFLAGVKAGRYPPGTRDGGNVYWHLDDLRRALDAIRDNKAHSNGKDEYVDEYIDAVQAHRNGKTKARPHGPARTRAGFETHYYHRITREKLPAGRDQRAARVIEINASLASGLASGLDGGLAGKTAPREARRAGTFADLVARYRASQKFLERSPATRKDYRPHLEAIVETWGPLSVRGFKRKLAYAMQEGLAATPRAANKRLTILSRLINFGIDKDEDVFGATNPVTKFERLKTGQRTSDVVAMPWTHYDGSGIEVLQQKTGERLWVPASAEFKAIVDNLPRRGTVIFTTKTGRAWGPQNIYAEIRKVLQAIGHEGYTPPTACAFAPRGG